MLAVILRAKRKWSFVVVDRRTSQPGQNILQHPLPAFAEDPEDFLLPVGQVMFDPRRWRVRSQREADGYHSGFLHEFWFGIAPCRAHFDDPLRPASPLFDQAAAEKDVGDRRIALHGRVRLFELVHGDARRQCSHADDLQPVVENGHIDCSAGDAVVAMAQGVHQGFAERQRRVLRPVLTFPPIREERSGDGDMAVQEQLRFLEQAEGMAGYLPLVDEIVQLAGAAKPSHADAAPRVAGKRLLGKQHRGRAGELPIDPQFQLVKRFRDALGPAFQAAAGHRRVEHPLDLSGIQVRRFEPSGRDVLPAKRCRHLTQQPPLVLGLRHSRRGVADPLVPFQENPFACDPLDFGGVDAARAHPYEMSSTEMSGNFFKAASLVRNREHPCSTAVAR